MTINIRSEEEGEGSLLSPDAAREAADIVIRDFWRLPVEVPPDYSIDVDIVSDSRIEEVNRKYLGRECATDVIAFSLMEGERVPEAGPPLIGQVVISFDTASRQAGIYGHGIQDEILLLFVHGLLHVAGWDEGEEIQQCQLNIIKRL